MKKLSIYFYITGMLLFGVSCEQKLVDHATDPCPSDDPTIICPQVEADQCAGASAGSANFSKFIALGSSYTAGFQAGALFTEGQNNSLPKILSTQFACAGGGAFLQPDIRATLGYNIFFTPNPGSDNRVLGRMLLQGASPRPTPQKYPLGDLSAVPNPSVNPGFIWGGSKSQLNNFAVQAIVLGQALIPETGKWSGAGVDPRFNPFYGRLAYPGTGTSTILGDAAAAGGTFFMFWLGMDDYLLHAAQGGDATLAPLTSSAAFAGQYNAAISNLLASNANLKGVVANFPSVFALPHFTSVPYNAIPLDAATAAVVNSSYAGYNQILEALKGPPFNYSAADVNARKITFAAGNNPFVIIDETLNNYTDEFDALKSAGAITDAQRAALAPYVQVRQTTSADIIPLSAGSVLGTLAVPSNPLSIYGVAVPMADRYALIPSEITAIESARVAFNASIKAVADANSTRLAFADVNSAFNAFLSAKAAIANNITLTPNINPPTGIYSEDGLHPNSRGYAFIANIFIDAINAKYGSTIPKVNYAKYSATALPIP